MILYIFFQQQLIYFLVFLPQPHFQALIMDFQLEHLILFIYHFHLEFIFKQ